jgi:alanyl aminopeptidase
VSGRLAGLLAALLLALAGCGDPSPPGAPAREDQTEDVEVPQGRLPADVRPTHYALDLTVVPAEERFAGEATVTVELDRSRRRLWLHGQDLHVTRASVELPDGGSVPATWEQVEPEGVAELSLERSVGPGAAKLRISWDAAFDRRLRGLFRVDSGGASYAFTQFEPILARRAFPSFDEPAFKARFDVAITAPREQVVVANTPEVETTPAGGAMKRVRFATTDRLPTYLVAFAVGPLDVVGAPPLAANAVRSGPVPFRGVAARGQGARLAYALAHTPPLLQVLEEYFAIPYPYEKLDVLAVPDLAWGGMENAGAITFRESLLLLDAATAPEEQRRGFAYVMAHELSHQWFGDLVTMPWWNDLWLNEAFATWMGDRVLETVHPEYQAEVILLEHVHGAMDADSLTSARRIRQPIETPHDIPNAFDAITYSKGAGVLAMFERWIGRDAFRGGIRRYLEEHREGNATAEDLMRALSQASGRDVATPFASFLAQPGVPLVEAELACGDGPPRLELRQARFLPVGSTGERAMTWQVPVCARYGAAPRPLERCVLLTERSGTLVLDGEGCPTWVMPNADGAGYYRWALPAAELARLRRAGWAALSARERLSVADSLSGAFASATLPAADVFAALEPLAEDEHRAVAVAPMSLVRFAREHLADGVERPGVEAFARGLYAPVHRRLGWAPRAGEDGEAKLLRAKVIEFLADVGRDGPIRREAARRGQQLLGFGGDGRLHLDAVAPELVEPALAVAIQEGSGAFFDALVAHLRASEDDLLRSRMLKALGAARTPALAERARTLSLDPEVRINETLAPLWPQMAEPATRPAAWQWIKAHFDALTARLSQREAGETPWLTASFCDAANAADVQAFFAPRIQALAGGPRNLAGAVEAIRLCAARVAAQRESARTFFTRVTSARRVDPGSDRREPPGARRSPPSTARPAKSPSFVEPGFDRP